MKVAIINTFNSADVKNWAGIPFHVSKMLEAVFGKKVEHVRLPPCKRDLRSYFLGFYYNRIRREKYYTWADKSLFQRNERALKKTISYDFDLIITFEFFLVPMLKTKNNKVIYWNDATFKNLINFYSGYSNISNYCLNGGHYIQKKSFDSSDYIIFSSDWAIDTAITYYGANKKKIKKISFASNLNMKPTEEEIMTIIKLRKNKVVKLLFLASEWDRKGGDDAVGVVNKLNQKGITTKLYVVGTGIPDQYKLNKNVASFGFLRKNLVDEENKLISLLKESSFLILPSRADCTPVAFSEANSYALPVIATNVGGISSVIYNNINGCCVEINVFVEEATDYIVRNLPETDSYDSLCYSSFRHYQKEMSWEQVEHKFKAIVSEIISANADVVESCHM